MELFTHYHDEYSTQNDNFALYYASWTAARIMREIANINSHLDEAEHLITRQIQEEANAADTTAKTQPKAI